jgi:hypothetical protein
MGMDWNEVAQDSMTCSCEHPNEPSSSTNDREFLDQLIGRQILKKESCFMELVNSCDRIDRSYCYC